MVERKEEEKGLLDEDNCRKKRRKEVLGKSNDREKEKKKGRNSIKIMVERKEKWDDRKDNGEKNIKIQMVVKEKKYIKKKTKQYDLN